VIEEGNWTTLTPEEKREVRFKKWLSADGFEFPNSEAKAGYETRVTRFIKAITCQIPDRVPVLLPVAFFPAYYAGKTLKTVMYDFDELKSAWIKFLHDFELDAFVGPGLVFPGEAMEALDGKLMTWPGHGLADHVSSYQFVEGEYMMADEYDDFIKDPPGFLLTRFIPRTTALKGFAHLNPRTLSTHMPFTLAMQYSHPEVVATLKRLMEAGQKALRWMAAVGEVQKASLNKGVPSFSGGFGSAPFDIIGDSLRGTKGIMIDMYRRPKKILEAVEVITPILIDDAINSAKRSMSPVVMIPLHKGTGGFMSQKQFETFYWPTLKRLMLGLIDEGLVPMPFAEGDYGPRLETIADMPEGKVIWYFENMDMARAKSVLGQKACIAGNLPVSVLCTATPVEVKGACKELIEKCAPGGGYILTAGASVSEGSADNFRAMIDAAKEYGVYR
jgi:uroporphyrinogen-III decarboxylase